MRNVIGTIFYMKMNVFEDFFVCISVLLRGAWAWRTVEEASKKFPKVMRLKRSTEVLICIGVDTS